MSPASFTQADTEKHLLLTVCMQVHLSVMVRRSRACSAQRGHGVTQTHATMPVARDRKGLHLFIFCTYEVAVVSGCVLWSVPMCSINWWFSGLTHMLIVYGESNRGQASPRTTLHRMCQLQEAVQTERNQTILQRDTPAQKTK